MAAGRNDPCPCGSGKKYKRCCLQVAKTQKKKLLPERPAYLDPKAIASQWKGQEEEPTGPTVAESMQAFKQRFFAEWPDEPNEKLDGATPRQAAQDPGLQPRLEALLKRLERREKRLPKDQRYDFEKLRGRLGLG